MKILVAFASKHGSTKGIADFIGEKIREKGLQVDVLDIDQVKNLRDYDAFVIGSAVYMFHWMKEATKFVSRNKSILSTRPVWLFSSGPTGTNQKDAKGRDLLDPNVSGPKELEELREKLQFRDHRIFFGAFDPKDLDFFSRQFFKSASIRDATPIGDFRDWKEIEAWVAGIAKALVEAPKSAA
jgi:menaquinone-dependent protoporphyrinogen oxidase